MQLHLLSKSNLASARNPGNGDCLGIFNEMYPESNLAERRVSSKQQYSGPNPVQQTGVKATVRTGSLGTPTRNVLHSMDDQTGPKTSS